MKRADFIKIIKIRSFWKLDARKGNYTLPNGRPLREYVEKLVDQQLDLDELGIASDGNLIDCVKPEKAFGDYRLIVPFANDEIVSYDEMQKRYNQLLHDIIGY